MKLIVNVETGETIERELTAEELAQQVIDQNESDVIAADLQAKADAKAAIATRLGLTSDELATLLG